MSIPTAARALAATLLGVDARVATARRVQAARFPADAVQPLNAAMTDQQLEIHCGLDISGEPTSVLFPKNSASACSQAQPYLKVARTIHGGPSPTCLGRTECPRYALCYSRPAEAEELSH
jgi:hypothetical protein